MCRLFCRLSTNVGSLMFYKFIHSNLNFLQCIGERISILYKRIHTNAFEVILRFQYQHNRKTTNNQHKRKEKHVHIQPHKYVCIHLHTYIYICICIYRDTIPSTYNIYLQLIGITKTYIYV